MLSWFGEQNWLTEYKHDDLIDVFAMIFLCAASTQNKPTHIDTTHGEIQLVPTQFLFHVPSKHMQSRGAWR